MFSYLAFGLDLRANVALPGLPPAAGRPTGAAVSVTLGALPRDLSVGGTPVFATPGLALFEGGAYVLFAYADGTRFAVRSDGGAVWGTWPVELTIEDAATYLLGPVMAFALRLRGRLSLHAAVFASGAAAVAIAGGPEAGKSTLLAALALRGVVVLSDDVAPLHEERDRFWVSPSYPRVRLWEDSVAALFGAPDALPRLTPNWEKRYLDVGQPSLFADRALPLAGVFVLATRAHRGAPRLEPVSPRDAFVAVLAHLHSVWMLPRSPQDEIFALASRLVERVPVVRLVPHLDPARLPELCELVLGAVAARRALEPAGRRPGVPAL